MRIEQISPSTWSLTTWVPLLFPVRIWIVTDENGLTLIDAGLSTMARGVLRFIDRLGRGPLQRILLTHSHGDHVGALKAVLKRWDVPVYLHPAEIPHAEGVTPHPGRKRAKAVIPPGIAQPLPGAEVVNHSTSEAPTILTPVAGLTPHWTPGHSPGHVAYHHQADDLLLAGDLFTSRRGLLRPPMAMFTSDMAQAKASGIRIVERVAPARLEVSHGGPVFNPAQQLRAYAAARHRGE